MRDIGSGNIGATNVLRTGSKRLAALTLLLDCLKATAAVLLAQRCSAARPAPLAAAGALIGHLYPVWLRFRGGKGVATLLGILIPLLLAGGARLCRGLDRPAADAPNFVGRGNGGGGQRADHARFVHVDSLLPNAARFRVAGAVEAPREHRSASRKEPSHDR